MTIRVSARAAGLTGLAALAVEAAAVATHAAGRPPAAVWLPLFAGQTLAVVWATRPRSAAAPGMLAPAGLTAVTVTAGWTALALVAPVVATNDTAALVAILVSGLVAGAVAESHRGSGRRLHLALLTAAGSALLIYLMISWFLPAVPGFISNSHPPIYTPVTRLVDPIGELAVFVLLAAAFGITVLRTRIQAQRAAARHGRSGHIAGPNEMVVERNAPR